MEFFSEASGREGSISLILQCLLSPFFSVALKRFCKGKVRGESRNWEYLSSYVLSLWQQFQIFCVAFWALPDEIYFPFLFAIISLSSVSKMECKKMFFLPATSTTFTSFSFFFPESIILGRKLSLWSFLTLHILHLVKFLVTSSSAIHLIVYFLLHAGQAPNKHTVCNFHSVLLFPTLWLFRL